MDSNQRTRRQFLNFLLASPLLGPLARLTGAHELEEYIISSPGEALNVFEFEVAARHTLPPAHFGYIATGVDGDATLRANREAFDHFAIRMHRLIDVTKVDMSVELFGTRWDSPIVLAPAGSQRGFHEDGEIAVAKAAQAKNHLQILSSVSSTPVEQVIEARQAPVWFQLYPTDQWSVGRALVKRAEAAGCPVLVLTVDIQGGSNRETEKIWARRDERDCGDCHQGEVFSDPRAYLARKPMFDGLDLSDVQDIDPLDMSWDYLKRLRDTTTMPIVIKGLVTSQDAELAIEHGVDAIIVSNHGGRGEESGRGTIDCLAEVIEGAQNRVPVMIDSGFRRGTDVFKALALGAKAVAIGRPYLWGLGSFGQPGVEAVLEILRRELETIMRQAGTISIDQISGSYLEARV